MTHTSTEDTEDMRLVSKRRKDMAAWAVENFKTWPKPHELTDVDPEEIGCELVVLNQHHLPVLRVDRLPEVAYRASAHGIDVDHAGMAFGAVADRAIL